MMNGDQCSLFDIYQQIASIYQREHEPFDRELFKKLKDIVTALVVVNPENRMKLIDACQKLYDLENFIKSKGIRTFLLLNSFEQTDDPSMLDVENSTRTLSTGASTKVFTTETNGIAQRITQRLSKLCSSISTMRLLCYALVQFLEKHLHNSDLLKKLRRIILEVPMSSKLTTKQGEFLTKLLTICCGVISPRSLNGLNFDRYDENQIVAQEQNISEFFLIFIGDSRVKEYWRFFEHALVKIIRLRRLVYQNWSPCSTRLASS